MFSDYGRLAWVDTPLEPNLEVMMLPRESRTFIAMKLVLEDFMAQMKELKDQMSSMQSKHVGH